MNRTKIKGKAALLGEIIATFTEQEIIPDGGQYYYVNFETTFQVGDQGKYFVQKTEYNTYGSCYSETITDEYSSDEMKTFVNGLCKTKDQFRQDILLSHKMPFSIEEREWGLERLRGQIKDLENSLNEKKSFLQSFPEMKRIFVNLTPHSINLNDGTVFEPSGTVCRVSTKFSPFNNEGVCTQVFGEVQNLPDPKEATIYIVSGIVLTALKGSRKDVVAPATGHENVVRTSTGQITSVPGFITA